MLAEHVESEIKRALNYRSGAKNPEDSFFILDTRALLHQVALWRENLPSVVPHYAVKCNNYPRILKLLVSNGVNFDCASQHEVELALAAGADPKNIIYANPVKAPSQLQYASLMGVKRTTFDSIDELRKVKEVAPQSELLLRLKTDDSMAVCSLSCKFGAALSVVDNLLAEAKKLELNIVGVAYHVGSGGGTGAAAHTAALNDALTVFKQAKAHGYELTVLDVGGGFEAEESAFAPVAAEIEKRLPEFPKGTHVLGEPGRFLAAKAMVLAASVIGVRRAANAEEMDTAYITDGVYGNLNSIIYDHQHPQALLFGHPAGSGAKASLWGPTCDGLDHVSNSMSFPRRLERGDWLVFVDCGAYTLVGESAFNGFNTNTQVFHA